MSKELTPLEVSKHLKDFVLEFEMGKVDEMFINNSFEIIEKALKKLERLENRTVMVVNRTHGQTQKLVEELKNYKNIEITNLEDHKKLKAFEIIKEKEILVPDFMDSCRSFDFTYFHYCKYQENYSYKPLTQEEFELLKEVLR